MVGHAELGVADIVVPRRERTQNLEIVEQVPGPLALPASGNDDPESRHDIAFSRRNAAELCPSLLKMRGRRESRTRVARLGWKAGGRLLTAYFELSLVTALSRHHHQRDARGIVADLTPASGRQDHMTSPSANSPLVRATDCARRFASTAFHAQRS